VRGAERAAANAERLAFYQRVRELMGGYDLLLTPTLPVTAFAAGDDHPPPNGDRPASVLGWTCFTYPFNMTGHPAATVPAGLAADGLPVGLQIVGGWREDATVLRAAAAYEELRPWLASLAGADLGLA
jgi:aspartyl-tRNA(Asn)/glutamyl-tRNA(Gln) amidotransferase subunit A